MSDLIPVSQVDEDLEMLEAPKTIWDHWKLMMPGNEPRASQVVALDKMAELPSHIKYVLLEMPVGGGKSPVAMTYASYLGQGGMGTSYILTPQRILQRQYEESFNPSYVHSVYGKANYFCEEKIGLDCDIAGDVKPKCKNCPAKNAFQDIQVMPHVVLNYKLALLYSELFPTHSLEFPVRDLMVFDECHTLEDHLVNHRAATISKNRCDDMKIIWIKPNDMKEAHDWLKSEYYPAIDARYFELEKTVKEIDDKYEFGGGLLASEVKTKREFKYVERHRVRVKSLVHRDLSVIEDNYVLVRDRETFQLKEVYGAGLLKNILLPKANKFLFMSSTILNQKAFCQDLGLPEEETAMITLSSEFDKDHRPVYFMPTAKMSYGWDKPDKTQVRNKMASRVKKLCEMHADDSGVIHTGSFKITKWLIGELEGKIPQEIVTHGGDSGLDRDGMIADFTANNNDRPMVLISPSVTEGLDLKDDIARFAIFAKVPYPFLGDEWVKRRLDLSDEWYQRQAMINIIQGGGRVVRTPDDWGHTYILDESFNYLWFKFKRYTPEWWKEAFSVIK